MIRVTTSKGFASFHFDTMTDSRIGEETPLLFAAEDPVVVAHEEPEDVITPLPKLQIGILLSVLLAEPMCSQCIYPFINQVTRHIPTIT